MVVIDDIKGTVIELDGICPKFHSLRISHGVKRDFCHVGVVEAC